MNNLALQYDEDFVETSVGLGKDLRALREYREALRQQLGQLTVRKMELQLTRKSLVVINIKIAELTAEKNKVVIAIDDLMSTHTKHLRRCIHR